MKRILLIWISGFILLLNMNAQNRVAIDFLPKEFYNPLETVTYNGPFTPSDVLPFTAVSDRDNNWTESRPNAGDQKCKLGFLDKVFAQSKDKGYAHIYRGDLDMDFKGTIWHLNNAVDLGYIKIERLLPWFQALKTKDHITKKAVCLNNIKDLKKIAIKKLPIDTVRFYSDPGCMKQDMLPAKRNMFQVLYVYKYAEEAFLLGDVPEIDNDMSNTDHILGWTSRSQVNQWDTKFAIEPNYDDSAVSERISKGIPCALFDNKQDASEYQKNGNFSNNIKTLDYTKRPLGKDFFRYPVHVWNEKYQYVSIIGRIVSSSREVKPYEAEEGLNAIQTLQNTKASKINLVFAIDGTKSMGPFFEAVRNALVENIDPLSLDNSDAEFTYGAAIYRDVSEGLIKRCETVAPSTEFVKVGEKIKEIGIWVGKDVTPHESVFLGLKEALLLFDNPEETNILIHIGDAGNHSSVDDQITESEIVNLMLLKNCEYIAYQAGITSQKLASDDFTTQVESIMLQYAKAIYRQSKQSPSPLTTSEGQYQLEEPRGFKGDPDVRKIDWPFEPRGIVYMPCHEGFKNDMYKLISLIMLTIDEGNLRRDALSRAIMEASQGKSMPDVLAGIDKAQKQDQLAAAWDVKLSDWKWYFMDKYLSGLTPEQLDFFKGERVQTYFDGYTSLKSARLKHPLFKYVVFIEEEELYELQKKINRVGVFPAKVKIATAIQDFWLTLYNEMTNEMNTAKDLENMTSEKFNEVVFGLPIPSWSLGNITFKELTDPSTSSKDLVNYQIRIEKVKQYLLVELARDDYTYKMGNLRYHWVTDEIIP